jgi:hypothetical protein
MFVLYDRVLKHGLCWRDITVGCELQKAKKRERCASIHIDVTDVRGVEQYTAAGQRRPLAVRQ